MKLLYDTPSGLVLCRLSESTLTEPQDGQAVIEVPASVPVPNAVVRVVSTEDGHEFIVDADAIARQWTTVKSHRSQLLKDSDWTCSVSDYTPPNKEQWIAYRQALRDLTVQPNPFQLVWPTVPGTVTVVTDPVVTEPVVTDPVVTEPVVTDPVVTDPITDPVVTVPVITNPVVTDPVVTDPVVTDPVITNPVVTDPVVTEPVITNPVVTDPVTDPVVTEPVVTDPVITNPVVTDPVVTEPVITNPVVTETVVTESNSA